MEQSASSAKQVFIIHLQRLVQALALLVTGLIQEPAFVKLVALPIVLIATLISTFVQLANLDSSKLLMGHVQRLALPNIELIQQLEHAKLVLIPIVKNVLQTSILATLVLRMDFTSLALKLVETALQNASNVPQELHVQLVKLAIPTTQLLMLVFSLAQVEPE